MTFANCFKCGKPGHWAAQCPDRVPVAAKASPPATPASPSPVTWTKTPGLDYQLPELIAQDVHAHAQRIRLTLGVLPHCGDPTDIYDSPARRSAGFRPIHLCQLRQIAARQLQEER
jgi:Zinc knuckle